MGKLLIVKVKKSRWHRGIVGNSALRMRTGKQCCIGFVARKLGATVSEIQGCATLADVDNDNKCGYFAGRHNSILGEAYEVNDAEGITDTERITKLRKIGREMGIKFVFVP